MFYFLRPGLLGQPTDKKKYDLSSSSTTQAFATLLRIFFVAVELRQIYCGSFEQGIVVKRKPMMLCCRVLAV